MGPPSVVIRDYRSGALVVLMIPLVRKVVFSRLWMLRLLSVGCIFVPHWLRKLLGGCIYSGSDNKEMNWLRYFGEKFVWREIYWVRIRLIYV